MNNPQLWGAIRGVAIAVGGALISMGVLKLTTEQLNQIITNATAIVIAIGGIVAVVGPMIQGWRSRSTKSLIETVSQEPNVLKVVTDPATATSARFVANDKVVADGPVHVTSKPVTDF